jgi:hypothetical protein
MMLEGVCMFGRMDVRRLAVLSAAVICCGALMLGRLQAAEPDVIVVKSPDFPKPATPPIGVNLEQVLDYSRSMMFVDLIKSARRFGTADAPWDEKAAVDENGWPTGDAGTVVVADAPMAAGDYLFSCSGRCDISVIDSKASVKTQSYDHEKKLMTATITVNEGATNLFLSFKRTNGGIKDIRLLRPGYARDTKEVFNKDFLAAIEPFSVLRCMDLTRTNQTEVKEWKERAKKTDALQSSKAGVAWEYAIDLANQTGKDLWINVPVHASDDYVKELAKLFKEKLNRDRCVYVEYSNEVWNTIFPQYHANYKYANEEVVKGGNRTLNDGGADANTHYWGWKRVGKRLVEISNNFRDVYAAEDKNAINTRVRPVLAAQSAIPLMARMQLDYIEKHHGAPAKFIYGVAGAPYIGPNAKVGDKVDATADELLESANTSGMAWIKDVSLQYQVLARYYRLHALCYEGGPGFDGEHSVDGKVAANRDPRIGKLIEDYLAAWYGTGGELFMYYNLASGYGKFGSWGLTEDIRKTTHKTKAILAVKAKPLPKEVAGTPIPATLNAWEHQANLGGGVEKSSDGGQNLAFVKDGHWFDYLLNVKEAGDYVVTFQTATGQDGNAMEALLSSTSLGTINVKNSGGWQTWANSDPIHVRLEKGQLVLRLKIIKGGMNFRSISIAKK